MLDWLTRPAEFLPSAGGVVASWFLAKTRSVHSRPDDVRNADAGGLSVADRILANAG
jgi:hypothetical protein